MRWFGPPLVGHNSSLSPSCVLTTRETNGRAAPRGGRRGEIDKEMAGEREEGGAALREERVTVMYMQGDRGKEEEGENKENGHRNYKEERRSFESWRVAVFLFILFFSCGLYYSVDTVCTIIFLLILFLFPRCGSNEEMERIC